LAPSETTWMKLAIGWADLDSALPGASLSIPEDIDPGGIISFWYRCTVPPGTPDQLKQDLALIIDGMSFPVIL